MLLACGEGSGGEGAFGQWTGDLTGVIHESRQDHPLGLEIQVGWGVSLVAVMGWGGCSTLSHPANFGVLSLVVVFDTGGVFGMLVEEEVVELFLIFHLREGYPLENLLISEDQVPSHLFPELKYTFC